MMNEAQRSEESGDEGANFTVLLYLKLQKRYALMAKGVSNEKKINDLMAKVVENCLTWPPDKLGRWTGYAQCLLIEIEHKTDVKTERDFTRPLFHKLYALQGYEEPESIEI